jgi:membrane-bound inhibitor of C-type lysozyme
MKRLALLATAAAFALPGAVLAQSAPAATSSPQAKANRIANQPARSAAPAAAPAPVDLPAAGGEQMAAASMAHFGEYQCEFNQTLNVAMNPKHDGYVDVSFRNRTYTMKPVLSHTGAVRLEDVRGQMLIVQIATKSMMIDTKLGQRIVDGCMHEAQRVAAAKPATGGGIGIEPARGAPATTAAR